MLRENIQKIILYVFTMLLRIFHFRDILRAQERLKQDAKDLNIESTVMNPKSLGWAQMVLNFLFPTCSSKTAQKSRKLKENYEILNCILGNKHTANVNITQILYQFVYNLIRGGKARNLSLSGA